MATKVFGASNDTTDDELEEIIQLHRERAAWFEAAKPAGDADRRAFQRLRRLHEDTAELLCDLASLRNPHDCECPCPLHCCHNEEETPQVAGPDSPPPGVVNG